MARFRSAALLLAASGALAAPAAQAQSCREDSSRTSLATFAGQPIASVTIVTLAPHPFPGPVSVLDRLHITTREATIQRQLLFAAGETLDTLRVAESLRLLRRRTYLADLWVSGRRCEEEAGVALTVTTRDTWSTNPTARVQSQTASVGIDERNVMGSGREAAAYVTSHRGQVGVGVAVRDPFLAVGGGDLSLAASLNAYRDGRDAAVTLENRRRSAFDPWHIEGTLRRSIRGEFDATVDIVRRDRVALLGGWAVHPSARGVTSLLAGVEGERTTLIAAEGAPIVGPVRVDRDFAGLDVGVRREAASYDTVTWLMPAHTLVDVPLGFETEAILGGGHDFERGQPTLHVDLWGGRVWNPDRHHLIVADLWSSGYWGDDRLDAASLRGELSLFRAAGRGLWIAHVAGERLINPDPDVRALASSDPTLAALPHDSRLARGAIAGSLERDIRIRTLSRSWALDAALFGAASTRWAPAVPLNHELYVGVLGAGLRVAPLRPARGTFRIDAGYPVTRSRELRRAPFLAISIIPWLGADRVRDGRKSR